MYRKLGEISKLLKKKKILKKKKKKKLKNGQKWSKMVQNGQNGPK